MNLLEFAIDIAKQAGDLTVSEYKKGIAISKKGPRDLVTNVDKATEKFIIKAIKKEFPDHGILAEESAKTLKNAASKEYIWIIDPIDGTTNFAHGIPNYAVSIAIFQTTAKESSSNYEYMSGELIAGVVHAPLLKETFYAGKGKGAFLNGKKIKTSPTKTIKDSVIATGFPYEDKEENMHYFNKVVKTSRGIRRFGAASLDLCYVAAGRFDAYWELGIKPWDIAAGALIVEEAGGKLSDTNGEPLDLFGEDILSTNSKIHKEMIDLFSI